MKTKDELIADTLSWQEYRKTIEYRAYIALKQTWHCKYTRRFWALRDALKSGKWSNVYALTVRYRMAYERPTLKAIFNELWKGQA